MTLMIYILVGLITLLIGFIIGVLLYAWILVLRHPIEEFYNRISREEDFTYVKSVPDKLIYYILQIEDENFYKHKGYDLDAIKRLTIVNVRKKHYIPAEVQSRNGIYGITHGAKFYFNKKPKELTINQMFMMACMICAPTKSNNTLVHSTKVLFLSFLIQFSVFFRSLKKLFM